ncbi:hypothetical protein KAU88_08265 [Candidatus Bathyarchaeota archaeon]|nr:hypothetical protein [Candidatus Bathyarchaeota archaeon]
MKKLRMISALALLFALIITAVPILGAKAQGHLIWEADVLSTGGPVTSPVLEAGRVYRIEAKGWFISCDPTYGWVIFAGDAQYYTDEFYGTFTYGPTWTSPLPAPSGHSFLQIDGMDVNWGPFSNVDHEYTIFYTGTGAPITFTIVDWIDENYAHNFCHIHIKIYEGPPPPRGETAFAYGDGYATCFMSMDFDGDGKRDFKNWGWSNGPLAPGSYTFDVWAGAAKCDLGKGTLVGNVTIDYDGSTATVTYMMHTSWTMQNTQLYVGSEPLPRDSQGEYTVAPGQYPYIHAGISAVSDTYTVSGLSGDIYVVAHADVLEV